MKKTHDKMSYTGPGHRHDLQAIARQAMLARGLLPDFSPAVMLEVSRLIRPVTTRTPAIRDLRGLLWCSIDNDDSRDLDQLTVAEPLGDGAVKILVAVADVDALAPRGSATDAHAQHNTTSVYTAAETFPMLPLALSTDLTSLGEDEDRLAIVIEMVVNPDGSLEGSNIFRARVANHAKLTYNSVAVWLDGQGPAPERVATVDGLDEQLRIQDRVAQTLRTVRHRHGALSLETIEPRAVFDDGVLTDLRVEEKNRARELIEDLMIAANRVTSGYLETLGLPSLRRILRSPQRWQRIVELAADQHERLPPEPDAAALEAFLSKRRRIDPARFPDLSLTVVKLIGRGEYVAEGPGETSPGHFGLAVQDYTHSTAPNRRFPDLITQRLLKAALGGRQAPYRIEELSALARHCTEQEDNASKVERRVRKSAAALLLESQIGQRFDAIVTGAAEKGTWVRIVRPPAEGKLVQGFKGLDVGDRLHVELISTDVERGLIDFARA
ncbi:ribonuclease II [Candidatus Methylomirabilis lanthanidiphila]|uniref:Ribonuclease II n=1 Tax=Candidatus Methylomirabilis lanthanidiphila TaxID=2211376 RepID=A0A564ZIJ3_9BACT|nr:RNB domain-containing ribonuclease [Candidatus Methylomirabilis lanthanidiphila]VUZ85135.1 ribonuclease II [Candidatus Methylomirabilis lanthanidiphila]